MGERDQPTRRMEELAASAVEVAEQLLGKPLDFTPESLAAVDELLGVLRPAAQGPPSEEAELAAGVAAAAGAYVGECLRRACGGAWTEGESGGPEAGPRLELADLRLDVLAAVASIGRGQALDLGDTTADSVEDLYQHLLQHHGAWFIGTYARLPDGLERALPEVADSPELALSVLQEAARAVYWASAEHGVVLDFSEESVGRVEGILATLHGKVRAGDEEAARLAPVEAAAYGSYLGEVLRRARGGAWARIEHEGQPLIVVRVDGARVNPMAVAHQRLVQGEEHDVGRFYSRLLEILRASGREQGVRGTAAREPCTLAFDGFQVTAPPRWSVVPPERLGIPADRAPALLGRDVGGEGPPLVLALSLPPRSSGDPYEWTPEELLAKAAELGGATPADGEVTREGDTRVASVVQVDLQRGSYERHWCVSDGRRLAHVSFGCDRKDAEEGLLEECGAIARSLRFAGLAANDLVAGGLYSTRSGDGSFGVVKLLAVAGGVAHVRPFRVKHAERPDGFDPGSYRPPAGAPAVLHAPFALEAFRSWGPEQIGWAELLPEEVEALAQGLGEGGADPS